MSSDYQNNRQNKRLERVADALDDAYNRAEQRDKTEGTLALDIRKERYIIFSDQHKGARNGADDFSVCERAYNAALAYYLRRGHHLIALGDVEELWEERPVSVINAYQRTFELEAAFHHEKRYLRIWGNHDDNWRYRDLVARFLQPLYGGKPLQVYESKRIRVVDGGEDLGLLYLIHGHQGSDFSDRYAALSRLFVRFIYRPWQRLTHTTLNTPATDWVLRDYHNNAMYRWAVKRNQFVVIGGHTHRPVFGSQSLADQIATRLKRLEKRLKQTPENELLQERVATLAARLEWVRAQEHQQPGHDGNTSRSVPCYFNSGCCCFSDGDITGIEIADGEIRLVRWPGNQKERPTAEILQRASIRNIFRLCKNSTQERE